MLFNLKKKMIIFFKFYLYFNYDLKAETASETAEIAFSES